MRSRWIISLPLLVIASSACVEEPVPCQPSTSSDLPGVSIQFDVEDCGFTRAELRNGVSIRYTVEVENSLDDVRPVPQDAGQCGDERDDSNLIPFAEVSSVESDDHWCMCDVGNCGGSDIDWTGVEAGTFSHELVWDGRNFTGPSDTPTEPGEMFESGDLVVKVSAVGQRLDDDGNEVDFEVVATLPIVIH